MASRDISSNSELGGNETDTGDVDLNDTIVSYDEKMALAATEKLIPTKKVEFIEKSKSFENKQSAVWSSFFILRNKDTKKLLPFAQCKNCKKI